MRTEVRGRRRFPSPPARIIAKTPLMDAPMDETVVKKRFLVGDALLKAGGSFIDVLYF